MAFLFRLVVKLPIHGLPIANTCNDNGKSPKYSENEEPQKNVFVSWIIEFILIFHILYLFRFIN